MRLTALVLLFFFASCGVGGGGGGGSSDSSSEIPVAAATAEDISALPNTILIGDRVMVTAKFRSIISDGMVARFKFPKSLEYVRDTAFLKYKDGTKVDIGPSHNKTSEDSTYLVFVLTQDSLDDESRAEISFILEGASEVETASIGVDPDFIDSRKSLSKQFDVSDPRFATKIETRVEVRKE